MRASARPTISAQTSYAELWVLNAGVYVKYATSSSVTVTDPGWTGQFTSAEATVGDQAFLGATSARFEWDQPLAYVRVDVVDSQGGVIGSCSTAGSLDCSAALALGPDESEMVHAEARAGLPDGGFVTVATSAAVELTGMDSNAYAAFLLTAPEASLLPLVGEVRTAQALAIRPAVQSETFCFSLGERYPSHAMFDSTVPDATLLCVAGTQLVLAALITWVGVDTALDIMSDAADTDNNLGAPSHDPEVGGTIFNDPDCHFYDFNGTCLELPEVNPAVGSHVEYAPMPDYWGGLICRAVHVDSVTGETRTYELRGDGLLHIVEDHVALPEVDDSVWDSTRFALPTDRGVLDDFQNLTLPADYLQLIQFLCDSLATSERVASGSSLKNPANTVNLYFDPEGFVGKQGGSSWSTQYFTVITTPQGQVWSAYPGTSDFGP